MRQLVDGWNVFRIRNHDSSALMRQYPLGRSVLNIDIFGSHHQVDPYVAIIGVEGDVGSQAEQR